MMLLARLALVSAVLSIPAAAAPRLELELGAGAFGRSDPTPSLTARLGLDVLGWLTPSLRVRSLTPPGADHQAWAVLGELRAHTQGSWQLNAGVGLGLSNASIAPGATGGVDAQLNRVAPYLLGDVGLRYSTGRFWVGLNVGGAPFTLQWMATLNVGVVAFG